MTASVRNGIVSLLRALDKLAEWVDKIIQAILVVVLTGIFLLMFSQVLLRYIIFTPFAWIEEIAAYLLPVLAIWGAAVCIRHGSHLKVDLLLETLPRVPKALLNIVIHLLLFYFAFKVYQSGHALVELGRTELVTSRTFSLYWPRMAIVIGGALIMFQSAVTVLNEVARLLDVGYEPSTSNKKDISS